MGMVQVETAMQMLERALPVLGATTTEGKAALAALSALSKCFQRQPQQDLVPAQIAQLQQAQQQSPIGQLMQGQGQPPMPMQ